MPNSRHRFGQLPFQSKAIATRRPVEGTVIFARPFGVPSMLVVGEGMNFTYRFSVGNKIHNPYIIPRSYFPSFPTNPPSKFMTTLDTKIFHESLKANQAIRSLTEDPSRAVRPSDTVQGLGSRVYGLGFRVLGFRV